jgi:RNA polymerase sigma-70 factor, ECF subfamily
VASWCARLGGPGMDSEAAAHEVLIIALRRQGELRAAAPVEPWVWGITTRVVRAHRRRAWLRRWLPGPVPTQQSLDNPEANEQARRMALRTHQILDSLSADHREVLVLCDIEERGRLEVAEILGLPEGTVKSRLRLARAAFRNQAEKQGLTFAALLGEDDV